MFSRREAVQLIILSPIAARAATPSPPELSIDGAQVAAPAQPAQPVSLSSLPSSAAPNTQAYQALGVRSMPAGTAFLDPVTEVRTVKLTASGVPGSAQYYPHYSTLGLSISQAWGPAKDRYTIALIASSGSSYLCDYQLGGTVSNWRAFPGREGLFSFSRAPGNERIAYIATGSQLRRYDTQANAYADTGAFPYSWSTGLWFQLNSAETWATALGPSSGSVTALNLKTGRSIVRTGLSSLDEIYMGYNNTALVNRGSTATQVWNLDTDSLKTYTRPSSNFGVSHCPSMNGFWMIFDSNTGGGYIRWARLYEDGSCSAPISQANGYWGQTHSSGHWWQQPGGASQWFLVSNDQHPGNGWTANQLYNLLFVNSADGRCHVLGHHYSDSDRYATGGTDGYYAQPHATQSTDGRIVVFGSNMLNGPRIDAFLMEVPV
jgi:hypothetical protein